MRNLRRFTTASLLTALAVGLISACGGRAADRVSDSLTAQPGGSQGPGDVQSADGGMADTNAVGDIDSATAADASPGIAAPSGCAGCSVVRSIPLSAGALHSCGVTAAGGVRCWGDNSHGQLGGGMAVARSLVPVDVVGL